MPTRFVEYRVPRILCVHKHVGGPFFWDRYSAPPYVGCRHGCEFCYLHGAPYVGDRDPSEHDQVIRVKLNAGERLRRELGRLPPDVVGMDGWQQPAESRYRIARSMLEVVRDSGLPLMVIERAPLLLRDLDLLTEINRRAWVGVALSFSNVDPVLKRAFGPRSPGLGRRLLVMEALARAGITVGMALMPVIPIVGDSTARLEAAVKATADHGGSFVVPGAMTMEGDQARRTLAAAACLRPASEAPIRALFAWEPDGRPAYSPPGRYRSALGLRVQESCERHGIVDHIPRYVAPGPLAVNKRLAERLFIRLYRLQLEQAPQSQLWAYRKAAWAVDEAAEGVDTIYRERGEAGLRALPGLSNELASGIARWLTRGAPGTDPRSVLTAGAGGTP
jgi:DNA repair photolyase